jgi:hypothetical protein
MTHEAFELYGGVIVRSGNLLFRALHGYFTYGACNIFGLTRDSDRRSHFLTRDFDHHVHCFLRYFLCTLANRV